MCMERELGMGKWDRRTLLRAGGMGIMSLGMGINGVWSMPHLHAASIEKTQSSVVVAWNKLLLQAIRTTKSGPSVVARALAIVHTSMYDAWAMYTREAVATQLDSSLRQPVAEHTQENKQIAVSYAAYGVLVDLFPTQRSIFQQMMQRLGHHPSDHSLDPDTAVGIGNRAAQAVIAFRHHDGSNQLGDLHPGAYTDYTGYKPVNSADALNDPNRWQPLRVADGHGGFVVQSFTTPQWNRVIPFALSYSGQFRPPLPPFYPQESYARETEQIVRYSAELTDRQKVIAEYWKDGSATETPPGHWCLFAQRIAQRDHHTLDDDVLLFFMLGNALLDASIACWDCKRVYDSVRPITTVRYLYRDQMIRAWAGPFKGTQWIQGKTWMPYQPATVVTPPFPEYCSGHSTFSAAAAEILRRFTGSDAFGAGVIIRAGTSMIEPGQVPARDITLSWDTFSAAANEAGLSRRYGGIHFEQGDLNGRELGRKVGEQAWRVAMAYRYGES